MMEQFGAGVIISVSFTVVNFLCFPFMEQFVLLDFVIFCASLVNP